jgi:hypothetical protein
VDKWVISLYVYDIWVLESYPIIYQQQNPIKEVEIRVLVSIYFSSTEPIHFLSVSSICHWKSRAADLKYKIIRSGFPVLSNVLVLFISVMGENRWNGKLKRELTLEFWIVLEHWTLPHMTNKNVCKWNQSSSVSLSTAHNLSFFFKFYLAPKLNQNFSFKKSANNILYKWFL